MKAPSTTPRREQPWGHVAVGHAALAILGSSLAACAGGSLGIGAFGARGGGGVSIGGQVGARAPYVVSEGEQPIQPGMTSDQVIQKLGAPYYQFGVRLDHATIWNYRMRYGSCLVYQVTMLPNGTVKEAGTGPDPACDVPDRGRM